MSSKPQPQEESVGPIRLLPGPNRGKYPHCHSVYVEGAKILIDPASDSERLKRLRDEEGVEEVWLSHWHEDHFAHIGLFPEAKIRIHPADAPPLADLEIFMDWYGMTGPENRKVREMWRELMLTQFNFSPRTDFDFFRPGEEIRLSAGLTAKAIHAPGHTPGHTCFHFLEPEVLFLADYDLTPFGPWYADPGGSIGETEASVRRLQAIRVKAWITAHEGGILREAPPELWDAYLDVPVKREEKILELLAEPRTIEDIARQWLVYRKPREPFEFYFWAERATAKKHLEGLVEKGMAVCSEGLYRRRD